MILSLAACTVGPDTGPDPEVEAAPYPTLSSVPQRPRLSYSIAQRREVADALVSDRANARYDREVARYELGLDDTPPPPTPPAVVQEPEPPVGGVEAVPTVPPEPVPPGGGVVADLAIRQQVLTERNNGRLATFMTILERQMALNREAEAAGLGVLPDAVQPDTLPAPPPTRSVDAPPAPQPPPAARSAPVANPGPAAQAAPDGSQSAEAAPVAPTSTERADALEHFSSFLGGLFSPKEEAPEGATVVAADAPAPAPPPPAPQAATPVKPAPPVAPPVKAASLPPPVAPRAATPPPSAPAPATATAVRAAEPAGPLSLKFPPQSARLPADAEPGLRAAALASRAQNRRLLVEGHGSSPTLGLDRARSVASWLMLLGAPPDMVTLKGGGAGETVIVHLLPSDAA